jgi:hypothetical protein
MRKMRFAVCSKASSRKTFDSAVVLVVDISPPYSYRKNHLILKTYCKINAKCDTRQNSL